MHGTAYIPLVKLISRLGIEYYYDDGSPLYYTEFGQASPQFKARNVCNEFLNYLRYWLLKNPDAADLSALDHITQFLAQHELISQDERLWAPEALREIENTLGLPIEEMSTRHLLDMLPPQRDLYVKGGYDKVVNHLEHAVRHPGSIRLGQIVDRIEWVNVDDKSHVSVHMSTSDDGPRSTVEADAVILTVPLGVLQTSKIHFEPSLPAAIIQGISSLSFGALGKVVFTFSDIFWSKQNDTLIYIPTPAALAEDSEAHKYPVLWHCFFVTNLWITTGAIKLCILLSPPLVHQVERMFDDQAKLFDFFEPLFELFRTEPYRSLPTLLSARATSWTQDGFAGNGSYSIARVGDDPSILWDALDAQRDSRLQFAGEHCSRTGTGCVHGAYESGEDAAKKVLDLLDRV